MMTKTERAKQKQITVRACRNANDYERGWDVEDTNQETITVARQRAMYYLTDTYRKNSEASERLMYSQVLVNGEVIHDYFGAK